MKNEGLQWQSIVYALHVWHDNILYKCVYTFHHTCVHAWIQNLTSSYHSIKVIGHYFKFSIFIRV